MTHTLARNPDLATHDPAPTVFSGQRNVHCPHLDLPREIKANARLKMDGLRLLRLLPAASIPVVFFDPQYRGILDKMSYGNEGKQRGRKRSALTQMSEEVIQEFVGAIDRALLPSGHLFLWIDKFHLCQGYEEWTNGTQLETVDLITWNKGRMGMGYRTRRQSEYLIVLQKQPKRAKGVWKVHNIPDVWEERIEHRTHTHQKPLRLQRELIFAVSNEGDYVVDPAAGSFSVMHSAHACSRNFIGCDLEG